MYKHIAAEVAALTFLARQTHPGTHLHNIAAFVWHDIHAGYKKHEMDMQRIDAGTLDRANTSGIVHEYNAARSCADCATKWCVSVGMAMCNYVEECPNIDEFEQYAFGIYLAHKYATAASDIEAPICPHKVRISPL